MRNKVKRTLSFLLTFVMLCSLLPAMALAQEPEGRYEEVEGTGAITENAKVEVYTTKGGGHVERTGDNLVDTTFPQMTGYREYTATPNTDWVFDTWRYEQWVGRDENNRKDVGNDTKVGTGRYSFSNTGNDWYTKYETGNRTISVNRLSLHGDLLNPIVYKVYADFNPTIKATAGANGTISDAEKQVEVTYGEDQAFDIKANDGYVIDTIKVDGEDVEEGKNAESYTYTFENVIEPHTIDVTFKVKPEPGKFTVTYEVFGEFPAGFEIPDAVTVNEGDIHTVADVPQNVTTDEGTYTFDGWYNGKDKVGATITVTSDVTLTGVWTFEGKDDVWNTVYGTIRVYMDEETKADFDALEGNLAKQVRLYSEKYLTDGYRLCGYEPINDFWYTTNSRGVTANDISKIVLAKDKAFEPSSKIEIPIKESGDYTVTVTEGTDKIGWISYSYLRIDITRNEPVEETVQLTYDMNGGTGENVTVKVPKGTVALDDVQNPTHDPVGDRAVVFKGWSTTQTETIYEPDAVPTDLIKTTLENVTEPVTVYAVWAYETAQVPETYPVQVVVYQNGNTETPVVTKTIGSYEKGAPFNVDSLNISDYYNSDYGFETTGWFNDGKWNEYKNGQNPAPLQGEITINGWTNVICMVTDKYPVHVFAVTDGDKANKEEIYSGTALKGTDLIAFLDQNVTVPEKEGYTVDKWYNWDWYGNKYAEDTKVNGWTNAYVTYTSNDTDRTVEVTFTVNSEYGSFTDYGKGPVTFKGLPENSTEQYSVPKVTANAGYKFVGWKGQGADVIEWGADASTFGVPGLCYFPEGSDVGYASIEAVFEEVPVSGKTVEVTFTVNPDYGTFTEYGEGPVTFKNIDAESTQQFEVPKVTAKKGYKFVGWKGQGADVIEWDANASTFGVPGLCYFAEGSNVGYASIAAVFEKEGGGHTNDYYVTVIVDGKGKVKAENYGTVGSNETEVIIIPDVENSVKFTMEPADGWKVDDVLVDGKSVGDVDSYVLKDDVMLEGPVLKVIFEKKSSGGGGGGSHDKDDDKDKTPAKTPDALNGEDHFDYIVGDADGRVHPERNITRAEVASIFFRLLKDDVRSENLTDQNTFTDVSADAWYNVAVSTMSDMDIVFGRTDYQFDPDAYITRAEFAAIAARFDSGSYSGDDLFTDIEGHWAADQINRAAEKGWITGYPDGTFGPNRYITRAEAVTMINRVLNRMPKDKDALHEDMKVFVDNADINAWYYLAIQEATNSHEYKKDKDGVYETWTDVLPARDWAQYLKLN